MKPIAFALFAAVGLSSVEAGSQAKPPAQAPPAGMSWEPNDVWKKVKPTTPDDFWPLPAPEENQPDNAKKKSPGKKSAGQPKAAQ